MPKKLDKQCVICGDRASGFNFNVITCESCKAFFRRNAIKQNSLRCLSGNVCEINEFSRKHCKKCRLSKCFDSGMRNDLILTEEERELRKQKIQKNKEIKVIEELTKMIDSCESSSSSELIQINYIESDLNQIEKQYSSMKPIDEISDTVYREAIDLEFSIVPFDRPITCCDRMNQLEETRLKELLDAMTALQTTYTSHKISLIQGFLEATRLLCIKCDHEIRKIIKMSKRLIGFKDLNETDQLILVKYSAIEIISLRMSQCFDLNSEHWNVIINPENINIIKLDLLKPGKQNYYLDFKQFYSKFIPELDSDTNIVDLLTAIILFDPKRPKLNQIEPIKFQHNIYLYLLQRYLQIKYKSSSDSITKFLRLLNPLNVLHIIDRKLSQNWSEAEPHKIMPLLREISIRND